MSPTAALSPRSEGRRGSRIDLDEGAAIRVSAGSARSERSRLSKESGAVQGSRPSVKTPPSRAPVSSVNKRVGAGSSPTPSLATSDMDVTLAMKRRPVIELDVATPGERETLFIEDLGQTAWL